MVDQHFCCSRFVQTLVQQCIQSAYQTLTSPWQREDQLVQHMGEFQRSIEFVYNSTNVQRHCLLFYQANENGTLKKLGQKSTVFATQLQHICDDRSLACLTLQRQFMQSRVELTDYIAIVLLKYRIGLQLHERKFSLVTHSYCSSLTKCEPYPT